MSSNNLNWIDGNLLAVEFAAGARPNVEVLEKMDHSLAGSSLQRLKGVLAEPWRKKIHVGQWHTDLQKSRRPVSSTLGRVLSSLVAQPHAAALIRSLQLFTSLLSQCAMIFLRRQIRKATDACNKPGGPALKRSGMNMLDMLATLCPE